MVGHTYDEKQIDNRSTFAEEDIHVVNKKMDTAYFNIKKRELGLPIWKDEISKVEEELMVCHEIGHAFGLL